MFGARLKELRKKNRYTQVTLAEKLGVDVPVSRAIYDAVYTDITPQETLSKLMNRKLKEEENYD